MKNIDYWIQTTDFEELNSLKKEQVLLEMSEVEYQNTRTIVLGIQRLKQKSEVLNPDASIKRQLLAQFSSPTIATMAQRVPLWHRPVPLWAVAAMLMGASILLWYLQPKLTVEDPSYIYQTKEQHDTIFKDKIKFIYKNKYVYLKEKKEIQYVEKTIELLTDTLLDMNENDPFAIKSAIEWSYKTDYTVQGENLEKDSLSWGILKKVVK